MIYLFDWGNTLMANADLEKMVDTSDEWIVARTGIKERRIAAETNRSKLTVKVAEKEESRVKLTK